MVEGTNQNFSILWKDGFIGVRVVGILGHKPGIGDDDASVRVAEDWQSIDLAVTGAFVSPQFP